MAVIDELIIIEGGERKSVDSAEDGIIDIINVEDVDYHFARESEVVDGVCENAVNEPIINMEIQGNSKQVLLPSEYQEVEHLENNGTQRIDVGLVPTNNTSITMIYQSILKVKI